MLQVHTVRVWAVCAYLIENDSALVLVDTGWPGNERKVLRLMQVLGRSDLRLIFITHAHVDHYGSAAALQRLTGAPVAIHYADAATMAQGKTPVRSARGLGKLGRLLLRVVERYPLVRPVQCDLMLKDGDDLGSYGLDAAVVYTPGHTPGSSCLFVEGRLAFVGDLLSNDGRLVVQRLYADDWAKIPASVARVQSLKPEWVYSGHAWHPLKGEALQQLLHFV